MTRLSGFEQLSGDEWQDLCMRVLHEHHPGPEFIEVPDDDRGDAGLEAFSLTGCSYQCYAPEGEPLSTGERYRKQRDKMTEDVGKFVVNTDKIKKVLPPDLKISYWVLLVPYINSRHLVEHGAKKTGEVRTAGLAYAAADIVVVALTLAAFERAREAVISRQLTKLSLPPLDAVDYGHLDDELIDRMNSKLGMTAQYADEGKRWHLVNRLLTNYIAGRAHRDHVRDHFSELGDQLEWRLSDLEDRLAVQYALDQSVPDRRLLTVLNDTEKTVEDVLNTHVTQSRVIAEGQVADWLMRCPLDFV
jgi:hypothetical protein